MAMMIYGNARPVFKKIHEQPADTSGYQRFWRERQSNSVFFDARN
jgi:hypothetical protein